MKNKISECMCIKYIFYILPPLFTYTYTKRKHHKTFYLNYILSSHYTCFEHKNEYAYNLFS